MQKPTGVREGPATEVLQTFLSSLRGLHVEAHVVKGEAETADALRGIVSKAASKSVIVAGIPAKYAAVVKAGLAGTKVTFVEDLKGVPPNEAVRVIASAETGVTWAVNGVALEGALLEVVYDDSAKLASSLPIVHVAILESSSVLRDLAEAMPLVGSIVKDAPPERKPIISFISGPSKTGDIEMRLLYGVHGPHTVHAVVLDWR
ncbi:MAG: lactate utilization protein [Thaumarchaeota archaeon]|nr:lactate utilization protein [Nitrososphaerota archaeon]